MSIEVANPARHRSRGQSRNQVRYANLRAHARDKLRPIVLSYSQHMAPEAAAEAIADDVAGVFSEFPKATPEGMQRFKAYMRGAAARSEMLEAHGGSISADEAGRLLGLSKTRVLERYREGTLLGIRVEKQNAVRFPLWQFEERRAAVRAGIAKVIAVFRQIKNLDDWTVITFFLSPRESLRGKAPVSLLLTGDAEKLVKLARTDVD